MLTHHLSTNLHQTIVEVGRRQMASKGESRKTAACQAPGVWFFRLMVGQCDGSRGGRVEKVVKKIQGNREEKTCSKFIDENKVKCLSNQDPKRTARLPTGTDCIDPWVHVGTSPSPCVYELR